MKKRIKKSLAVLLAAVMVFGVLTAMPCVVSAAETVQSVGATSGTTGDCTWTLDGTELTISGNGAMANYKSSYGLPWNPSVTKVTIKYGVTNIGNRTFYDCINLKSITIPDSVTRIGDNAFCNCKSLTSVSIPYRVTSISENTFSNCESLTNVTIPNSVTSIGKYAFAGCSSLTGIDIPDSVTSIGESAFVGCTNLTSITISDRVTSIGESPFGQCSNLANIVIDKNNTKYDSRGNCNAIIEKASNTLIQGCKSTKIPDSVTKIAKWAFYYYTSLTSIAIPDSVTSIGDGAFYNCTNLTSVTISNRVTSISNSTFYNCTSLTSIAIPDSVTSIGVGAFYNCTNLTSVTIPNSVTSIGKSAFSNCSCLTSVYIPDSVSSISESAFSGCTNLTSVTIPNSMTSIGKSAFSNCSCLTSVYIPDRVSSISESAFSGCTNLTSVSVPDTVEVICRSAFSGCAKLSDVYFDGSKDIWDRITIHINNSSLLNATIHYNMSSLTIERTIINTKTNYYGAANYESSKAGEVQDAAIEFKEKLETYYNSFISEGQKKIGNTNSLISLDELAKQLRRQDESTSDKYITMIDSNVPSDCLDSVYYALADFLTNVVNNNVDLGSIDYSKDSITNAAKIVNAVKNGMRGSGKNSFRKGNYEITFNTQNMWGSFAGAITAKKESGFNSGSTYTGEIDSTIAGTKKVLTTYMDCMSDIVKDACKYALFSILSEYKSVTGIAEFEKTELENFLSDKVDILQKNGFGNVLGLFLNTRTGYKAVKPILNANTGGSLRTALNNAQRIYDSINEMEFSTQGINKKAVKEAVKEVEKARKKLANKLFNYIYNTDEPLEEEGGFWDWIKNIFGIKCPVEFEIYDNNGNLIGYVDSSDKHEDYIWHTDDIYIEVDGDSKFVYAPVDMELNFKFTAIDDGVMNYTIERQNGSERIERLNYFDVPLSTGETYDQNIPANVVLNSNTELPLVGNDEINYDKYLAADNLNGHINVTCEAENGTVIGDGAYPMGDLVKLVALENDEYKFKGWSVDGAIVETSEIYRFTAKENITVKAVFEKKKNIDHSYTTAYSDDYSDSYIELIKQSDDTRSVYISLPSNEINDVALTSIRLFNDAHELFYSSQYDGLALSDFEIIISDLVLYDADRIEILDRNNKLIAILEKNDLTAQQIILDKDDLTMEVNESIQINAFPIPVTAQSPDIRWESTNPDIATVDDSGIVTAVSPGKTIIKCFALDNEILVECEVIYSSEFHPFVGHSLTLSGDIGINYFVDVSDSDVNDGIVKVDFTWTVNNEQKSYSVTLTPEDKTDYGYKATCPIPVAEMTYDVTAVVTIDGVLQSKPDTYSVQKYAKVILNNENNFKENYISAENSAGRNGEQRYNDLVTLVQAMLDYGTKAQITFERDVENPANEGTDYFSDTTHPVSSDMITVTEENMDMDLSAYGLRYKGSTVVYLSETSIRHYYYVDDWDSFNVIKDSVTFDGAKVTYSVKDDAIYFEKKGIGAADLDTPYTLTIKDKSCKYSVNDYIRRCLDSDKVSDNTKALVKATYRYNVAANTYFEI